MGAAKKDDGTDTDSDRDRNRHSDQLKSALTPALSRGEGVFGQALSLGGTVPGVDQLITDEAVYSR